MPNLTSHLAFYGYGVAAALFLLIAVLILASWKGQAKGGLLALAVVMTALWSGGLAYSEVSLTVNWSHIYFLELARDTSWLLFLAEVLNRATGGNLVRIMRLGGPAIGFAFLGAGLISFAALTTPASVGSPELLTLGSLVTSLCVVVYLEQIFRNSPREDRKGLKYFCIATGSIFIYDIVLYSDARVAGHI
ncbi:MAG TPA: hypothetical protein VIS57_00230, partial [Xanthomonadales bacterium]